MGNKLKRKVDREGMAESRMWICSPEELWEKLEAEVSKKEFRVFLVLFLLGIVMLLPMMADKLAWSDLNRMGLIQIPSDGYDWIDYCGRYLARFYAKIRSFYVYNWVSVLFYILWALLGAFVWIRLLRIRSWMGMVLAGAALLFSPAFFEVLPYCLDDYILAFFLCSLSVLLLEKKRTWGRVVLGGVFIWMGCALYQAYFFAGAVLCLFVLVRDLFEEKLTRKEWWDKTYRLVMENVLGLGLYFVLMRVFYRMGWSGSMAGRFESNLKLGLGGILAGIGNAYRVFAGLYFNDTYFFNSWRGIGMVNRLVLILFLVLICRRIGRLFASGKIREGLLAAVLVMLSPAVLCGMAILDYEEIRLMLLPTMTLPYLGLLGLWENAETLGRGVTGGRLGRISSFLRGEGAGKTLGNLTGWCIYLTTLYLVFHMGLYVSIFQLVLRYHNEKDLSVAQEIIRRVDEKYPEVSTGSAFLFIYGDPEDVLPDPYNIQQTRYILKSFACTHLIGSDLGGYLYGWTGYLNYNFGRSFRHPSSGEAQTIMATEEYQNLGIFPAEDSITMTENGVIVVKLKQ